MSTPDDQTKAVPEESGSGHGAAKNADKDGAGASIILFFIVGFVASLVVGWVIFPQLLYSTHEQPVAFNHQLHNEMVEESCESCHFFREDGTYSGVPKLAQCNSADCHGELLNSSPDEEYFYTEYVAKNREVPWKIYARQPPCVFFSHAAHVTKAGMDCKTCHGDIGESEYLRPYQENRISRYSRDIWGHNIAGIKRNSWDRMKMNDCANCHRRENVNQNSVQTLRGGCFVCHN